MATPRTHLLLALASGLLLALAYPPGNLEFLVWIGFIPLLYVARKAPRGRFFLGLAAGMAYYLFVFQWLLAVDLQGSMGIENRGIALAILIIVWMLSSLIMAAFWGLFARFSSKTLLAAPLFVILEYLRAGAFGLFWYGSGALLGPHWTMGNVAYALAQNPAALQLASVAGIYGITLLVMGVNSLALVLRRRALAAAIIAGFALLPRLVPSGEPPRAGDSVPVALIQTNQANQVNFAPSEILTYFNSQLSLMNGLAQKHPKTKVVVFPETNGFLKNLTTFVAGEDARAYFQNLFPGPTLIASSERVTLRGGQIYSRVYFVNSGEGIADTYDKQLLTPLGEFLPWPAKLATQIFARTTASKFQEIRGLDRGMRPGVTVPISDNLVAGALVCSEFFSPNLARAVADQATILTGHTSNAIFRGNSVVVAQVAAVARLRAAENRKPVAIASNMGLSHLIDHTGETIAIAPNQEAQLVTGTVHTAAGRSWYNRWGDWPVLALSLGILALLWQKSRRHEQ